MPLSLEETGYFGRDRTDDHRHHRDRTRRTAISVVFYLYHSSILSLAMRQVSVWNSHHASHLWSPPPITMDKSRI